MKYVSRIPPKLATALLKHLGPENDALIGDLREACLRGKSRWWYWGQVITIIAMNASSPGLHRVIWSSLAVSAAIVVVLELPSRGFIAAADWGSALLMMLYLVPSALPIALPIGLTVGTSWGMGDRSVRHRVSPALMMAILVCVVASFATVAWVVPASNQAFRVTVAGPEVLRGANELSLSELRPLVVDNAASTSKLVAPNDHWHRALSYYGRLAVAFEPVVFAGFVLVVAGVARRKRLALVAGVGCAFIAYFLIEPETLRPLSPIAVAWLPNAALALLSLFIGWSSSRGVARL